MNRDALADKVMIVTGAGSGIGRATAIMAAKSGARIAVVDRDLSTAEATVAEIGGSSEAQAIGADVSQEDDVRTMVERIYADFGGRIDVLANVAGIGSTTSAVDTELQTWEAVFAVNVRGVFLCCKHALPVMLRQGSGSIVNMASIAGLVGLRNRAAYCASKGAVIALTRALAIDHIKDGIRVNCVCPGTIATPWVTRLVQEAGESLDDLTARQPMGRLGAPDEVAATIIFLASDDASFSTGAVHVLDGGLTAA